MSDTKKLHNKFFKELSMSKNFQNLARRFLKFEKKRCQNINYDLEIANTMTAAGKVLYSNITQGNMPNIQIPLVFKEIPARETFCTNQQNEVVVRLQEYWDTYWWHFICWCADNRPDWGIVLPYNLQTSRMNTGCGDFGNETLPRICKSYNKISEHKKWNLWCSISEACRDICELIAYTNKNTLAQIKCDQTANPKTSLLIDNATHTIIYGGRSYHIAAQPLQVIKMIYDAQGKPVSNDTIGDQTGRGDINVLMGEVRKKLKQLGLNDIAKSIRNQRTWGYYWNIDF